MKQDGHLTFGLIGVSSSSELDTAPGGGTHPDGAAGSHGAPDRRLLSRERVQPPAAGVRCAVWELDRHATHRHAPYRFGG